MAHKKGGGSTRYGRDSQSKRLGVKRYDGQLIQPGTIIVRQRGTRIHPGNNVGIGRDFTIYSRIEGKVKFEPYNKEGRKKVSVYPPPAEADQPLADVGAGRPAGTRPEAAAPSED